MPNGMPPPLVIALGQACEHLRAIVAANHAPLPETQAELLAQTDALDKAIEDARAWLSETSGNA